MKEIDIFVGRQPILNRDGDIFAYELLYRNSKDNFFPGLIQTQRQLDYLSIHFCR